MNKMLCGLLIFVLAATMVLLALCRASPPGGCEACYGASSPRHHPTTTLAQRQKRPFLPLIGDPLDPVAVSMPPEDGRPPVDAFEALGRTAARAAVEAAAPTPPRFEPEPELGAQRSWQPTFSGVAPTFVDAPCPFFQPSPRLWATNTNDLMHQRAISMGVINRVEPQRLRQSMLQFLTMDYRTAKDPYTRATASNDLTHGTCEQLARETPRSVNF